VLFAISYLEEGAFEFIEVYLDDYNDNSYKDQRPDTKKMFNNIKYFVKVIKEVYGELYKEEKAT